MSSKEHGFGEIAKSLSKNPLGIIALFIVLVYGFACLVTATGASETLWERLPLIYFLVLFPVLVLAIFAWLVSNHSKSLYGPTDFKDEANYVKMQMAVVASLAAATAKTSASASESDLMEIIDDVRHITRETTTPQKGSARRLLWVDDRPENNVFERNAFEAMGIDTTLAYSTDEALKRLSHQNYFAIISDMGRKEGPREGYALLDTLRSMGNNLPLFFYASSSLPEHKQETEKHGGQGCTDNANELFRMVMDALKSQPVRSIRL